MQSKNEKTQKLKAQRPGLDEDAKAKSNNIE